MRSVSLPAPLGFHTSPARGAKFHMRPFHIALGSPGSPLKNRPAGALGYTLLTCPAAKPARLKEVPRPYLSGSEKVGSQRSPRFNVKRGDKWKVSCT